MVQELTPGQAKKKIVGLTGIFGSGKSTVANLFRELGAAVVDADLLAREALMAKGEILEQVKAIFPAAWDEAAKEIHRGRLAAIIFDNIAERKKLEEIVHPYVLKRMIQEAENASEDVVILDVPLLYEAGFDIYCDCVIVVSAAREVILDRLAEKDFNPTLVQQRWRAQWTLEEKCRRADFVIDNSQSLQQTHREVEKIWKQIHPVSKGAR